MSKGQDQVKKLIYGRTILTVLFILIQIAVLIWIYIVMRQRIVWVHGAFTAASLILTVYLLNTKGNPMYKIAWILLILTVPVFGSLFYLLTRVDFGTHKIRYIYQQRTTEGSLFLEQNREVLNRLQSIDPQAASTAVYLEGQGYPIYDNGTATYFPLGEDKFSAMIPRLEQAKDFIFLEYFIVSEGRMWDTVVEILERKAKEGVDVRMIYDGMGCLTTLPYDYFEKLRQRGIQCKVFSPIKPVLSSYQNNRDHRKILVIDGEVAFTGGINLADEYINEKERFGHWKDTAVMVEGDAVRCFTTMFLQMWGLITPGALHFERYLLPLASSESSQENGFVIPYGETPLDDENTGEQVYFDMIHQATSYVHIMTPYLILDNEMVTALTHAARRGVEVQIILPHIPDKPAAFWLAKTYYKELLKSGVEIFEYTPGFVHAKVFVSDDNKGTVGTINFDYRSLYLHFECGAYFYGCDMLKDIEKDFQATLTKCHRVTEEDCKNRPLLQKLFGYILRIFAPLM